MSEATGGVAEASPATCTYVVCKYESDSTVIEEPDTRLTPSIHVGSTTAYREIFVNFDMFAV